MARESIGLPSTLKTLQADGSSGKVRFDSNSEALMLMKALFLTTVMVFALAGGGQIPAEWKDRYREEAKLITTKNFAGWKALIAESYVLKMKGQKDKDRNETIEDLLPIFRATKIMGDSKPTRVIKRGNSFEVSFDARFTFIYAGKGTFHYHEVGTDTWKKLDGRWAIVRTVDTLIEHTGPD